MNPHDQLLTLRRFLVSTIWSLNLIFHFATNCCMTTQTQTSRLSKAGRWLAILAVTVLWFGKLVHLGQECDNECCSSSHCHVASQESERPCPFGCKHHSHTAPTEPCEDEAPNDHDEHHCAICSVLSHVTQCPEIAGLPAESEFLAAHICVAETMVAADILFPVHPRGPPSIG